MQIHTACCCICCRSWYIFVRKVWRRTLASGSRSSSAAQRSLSPARGKYQEYLYWSCFLFKNKCTVGFQRFLFCSSSMVTHSVLFRKVRAHIGDHICPKPTRPCAAELTLWLHVWTWCTAGGRCKGRGDVGCALLHSHPPQSHHASADASGGAQTNPF